jgi:hypothetical protein
LTGQAEAEAWVRKPKRIIQNQSLIQLVAVLAIMVPLPTVGIVFWLVFAVCPSIVIPIIIAAWIAASVIYASLSVYARIKLKHSL